MPRREAQLDCSHSAHNRQHEIKKKFGPITYGWPPTDATPDGFSCLPFTRLSFGSFDAVQTTTEFDRLRAFNDRQLADYACICVYLLISLLS